MGTVYKRKFTRPLPDGARIETAKGKAFAVWTDATGKAQRQPATQVKGGAWRIAYESSVFVAKYRGADGVPIVRPTGCKTLDAARSVLADFERETARLRIGAATPPERALIAHGTRPLPEHVADYIAALRGRGVTKRHADERKQYLDKTIAGCAWRTLKDVCRADFERWIGALRDAGTGARAINVRIVAGKAFCNWLAQVNRLAQNPIDAVQLANEKADRRHERRARAMSSRADRKSVV